MSRNPSWARAISNCNILSLKRTAQHSSSQRNYFDEGREIGHQLGWAQRFCFHHTLNYFLIKKQKQEAIMYFFLMGCLSACPLRACHLQKLICFLFVLFGVISNISMFVSERNDALSTVGRGWHFSSAADARPPGHDFPHVPLLHFIVA